MTEQANKNCFNPKEFVVERIEDSFLRLRKLRVCLIIYLVLALAVTCCFLALILGTKYFWLPILALFVFFVFSIVPALLLIFIVLRLTDVDGVLSRNDCGDVYDFAVYLRSLRNLAAVCTIFWFLLPILGITLGFILRRRMRDVRDMWMSRFNPEPSIEVEEPKE